MLKKDKTKPFRAMAPDGPTSPTSPTAEDMLNNCAINKLKADRTPIPDNRFTLPPEYGVAGGGSSDAFNGHEYVDLGLPSGTLWAKMNVGAESETDAGLYFAWGETEGYTASQVGTDKNFSWSDYTLTEDSGSTMTKYNATDGKTHLELTDDAAAANMGGDWHMPNRAQFVELLKETKNGFVTNAGAFTEYVWDDTERNSNPTQTTATISGWDTAGYFFFRSGVSDIDAAITDGDYLFIPAAGECGDGETYGVGYYGYAFASYLDSENVLSSWFLIFGNGGAGVDTDDYRSSGQSVRGVVGQMDEITDEGEDGPK